MANFLLVRDLDPERRARYLASVRPTLAPFSGMVHGAAGGTDLDLLWAVGSRAPVSVATAAGGGAVLFGDARDGTTGARLDAGGVLASWRGLPAEIPAAWDGFHAGVAWDPAGGFTVGADLLGLFPVYYWVGAGSIVVATSPEIIACHPSFTEKVSLPGLAGILIMAGIVGNQPLLEGIRRLPSGHLLHVPAWGEPREIAQYAVPLTEELEDLGFTEQVEALASAVTDAVRRALTGTDQISFLLSGGLDSRMLAGVLATMGRRPEAVTFGDAADIEARCAMKAASVVRFPHHLVSDAPADPVGSARAMARYEHLGNGFFGGPRFHQAAHLSDLPQPVVTGYIVDDVVGPKGALGMGPGMTADALFDRWFERRGRWGLPPGQVDELLDSPGIGEAVLGVLRDEIFTHPRRPSKSIWASTLRLRSRFHVGASLWRTSFFNWPVNPVLDQRLLAIAGALPISTLGVRRAQKDFICRHFPALAAAPLDRNGWDDSPLQPRLRHQIGAALRARLLPRMPRWGAERRYYYRIADFNASPWTEVRQAAESGRERLSAVVRRTSLDSILPGPDVPVIRKEWITETAAHRNLVGLMLWAADRSFDA